MTELILHHYDRSPFSEKIRLIFGLKRLAWRSVIVPMTLPKPDLLALTGGFRRTPVLQIGADVYCDTSLVAAELDRRFPDPTLFPSGQHSLGEVLSLWAERVLFGPTARYVTGMNTERLPTSFHADRAAMRGHRPPEPSVLAARAAHELHQIHLLSGPIETLLADGRPYLTGAAPALGDFAVYGRYWWLGAFGGDLSELASFPRIRAWMVRVAGLGHGDRQEMTAEASLDVAQRATPLPPPDTLQPSPRDPAPGTKVIVETDGEPSDPTAGLVEYCSDCAIGLRRSDPQVGTIVAHFPRLGYVVRAA